MSLGYNDAEQIVVSFVDGKSAASDMAVIGKKLTCTLADGATDFALGDKFTSAITQNPPAAATPVADARNVGNGTPGAWTLIGEWPAETLTFTCIAVAANAGTFKVEGSKTGRHANLTVAVAYSIILQQLKPGDKILSFFCQPDAGGLIIDDTANVHIDSAGVLHSATDLSTHVGFLTWLDRQGG